MQIGDDEQALLFPEQRAGEIGDERHAGDTDDLSQARICRIVFLKDCAPLPSRGIPSTPIASLTSSSAASASSSSDASP